MTNRRPTDGRPVLVVHHGEAQAGPGIDTGTLELIVRHKWDQAFILIVALTMLCVGILCGLVASHVSAIERLEHENSLTRVWAQTHRHAGPGGQPMDPGEAEPKETEGSPKEGGI
jgi:hypothetical protein